jgi:hypothetical protein
MSQALSISPLRHMVPTIHNYCLMHERRLYAEYEKRLPAMMEAERARRVAEKMGEVKV